MVKSYSKKYHFRFFMSCEKFFNSNAGNAMRDSSSKRYNFLEQKERKLDRLLMNLREELHWLSDYKETIFCLVQHKKSSTDRRLHLTQEILHKSSVTEMQPFRLLNTVVKSPNLGSRGIRNTLRGVKSLIIAEHANGALLPGKSISRKMKSDM